MTSAQWTPEAIRKKHVLEAAKFWREQGNYAPFHNSRSYDVIVNSMPYPPKAIASKAHEYATGMALKPTDFVGARDGIWHQTLKALGFQVVEKGSDDAFAVEVANSLKGSRKARLRRLAEANTGVPVRTTVSVRRFIRNPDVVAERLHLSLGKCGKCKKDAPFKRLLDGTPYLEVHHIKPLSEDGPDTVENTIALCPNCHAKVHDEMRLAIALE